MNDDQGNFDDSLHALVFATRRPSKDSASQELQQLQSTLSRLIDLCGQDEQRWKTLLLCLAYKRYHLLSPQAKAEAAVDGSNNKKDITAGQGERLIFYTAARILFEQGKSNREDADEQWASKALSVLCQLAPLAGGARDICALIQDFVHILLEQELKQKRDNMMTCYGKESLPSLVASGVQVLRDDDSNAISAGQAVLNYLVQLAADLLDHDLNIVDRENHKHHDKEQQQQEEEELPSTIHMYIPHRDRGRIQKNDKKRQHEAETKTKTTVSDRQLVNSVAEILIWSKTVTASNDNVFVACYDKMLQGSTSQDDNKAVAKTNLFTLQTIIRKKRQQLNSYARNKGFMLSDQFVLDPHVLNLQRIRRGKAGDIASLTRLAKKKQDESILKLINARFSDPAKATKFGSISEMISAWTPSAATASAESNQVEKNEIVQLERDIFSARVKATIKYLSNVSKNITKSVLIASMDISPLNHVAAVLMAATLSSDVNDVDVDQEDADNVTMSDATEQRVRLFIGGVLKSVHSFDSVLNLLDEIICGTNKNEVDAPSFMTGHTATTKAVLNMMDRHLHDNEALLLLSSADILVPSDVMSSLTARGCGVHCHDTDVIGERLAREGARKGDITISLAWDTEDDLDLHVIIPSREHISYNNKKSRDGLCMLDVDMNAGGGGSTEPIENVFCGDLDAFKGAPKGHYKVVVQNYTYYRKSGHPIPFRVVVEKNGTKESFSGECVGSGSASDVVVTEFDYSGRTVPFPSKDGGDNTAFGTSNMVNLTASTGQTIESLGQLTQTLAQLEHLDEARQLVNEEEEEEKKEVGEDGMEESRPLLAGQGTLEVTSRDLLKIHLAKLPPRFHQIIGETFGGPTLAEECARELGQRMVTDKVPISELKRHGYPDDIVQLVKKQMATAAAP